jgi:hypothetical protein
VADHVIFLTALYDIAQFNFVFQIFKVVMLFHLFQIVFVLYIYFRGLICHLFAFDAKLSRTKFCSGKLLIQNFDFDFDFIFQWQMQLQGIIGFPFFYILRILILDFQFFFFFFPNFLLNCNVEPMFCNLNLLVCCVGCLNFTWMLQFKMLWVLLIEVDWITYSIFVLWQHLHLQMLDLDLCFIFIFRVQTFTYSDFCTLR